MTTFFLLQLSVCLPLQTTLTVDGQGVIPVQHKQLSQKAGLTTCFNQLGPTNDDTPPICENRHRQCLLDTLLEMKNPVQYKRSHEEGKGDTQNT